MALKSISELVKNRIPFWNTEWETVIDDFILEQYYYLQTFTGFDNSIVEEEAQYTGLLRILVAELSTYELVERKVISNTGGISGASSSGGKRIKKAEADVVNAEFEYSKASDGNDLLMQAEKLLIEIEKSICDKAAILRYRLPRCGVQRKSTLSFKTYTRNPITGNFE